MPSLPSPVRNFALKLLLILPPVMALWWLGLLPWLEKALEHSVRLGILWLMPEHLFGLVSRGEAWELRTSLTPLGNAPGLAVFQIDPTRFTVSFPLFWTLALATPGKYRIRLLIAGTVGVLIAVTLNLMLYIQFKLGITINHLGMFGETPDPNHVLAAPYPDALFYMMGVGRQLSLLVLPTVIPVVVWAGLHPAFRKEMAAYLTDRARPGPAVESGT